MSAYMNPSAKVTELLSKYLEFDHEKLELGIWNGNLSLSDVHIRKDALYDIMNKNSASSKTSNLDAGNVCGFDQQQQQQPPPLRFRLVSGTIGQLKMSIPWKRLVTWGQGDVQAELKNVTIVLELEHAEDAFTNDNDDDDESVRIFPKPALSVDSFDDDLADSPLSGTADATNSTAASTSTNRSKNDTRSKILSRDQKQKRLREAERRVLQGRPLAAWMKQQAKKDLQQQKAAKAQSVADSSNSADNNNNSTASKVTKATTTFLDQWLKTATNDFFWRFYAGLELTVENVKIVLVQDGVEMGILIPKSIVTSKSKDEQQPKASANMTTTATTTTSGCGAGGSGSQSSQSQQQQQQQQQQHRQTSQPPGPIASESGYEDGEHVDKTIKSLGVCVYARKAAATMQDYVVDNNNNNNSPTVKQQNKKNSAAHPVVAINVLSNNEYMIRPIDFDVDCSLFYPYPPEKRKKLRTAAAASATTSDASSAGTGNSSNNSKASRRGKREKAVTTAAMDTSNTNMTMTTMETATAASLLQTPPPLTIASPRPFRHGSLSSTTSRKFSAGSGIAAAAGTSGSSKPLMYSAQQASGRKKHGRRGSIAVPLPTTTVSRLERRGAANRRSVASSMTSTTPLLMPLAESETFDEGTSTVLGGSVVAHRQDEQQQLSASIDGRISIADLTVVCSTRHYELLNTFLITSSQIRNGRPKRTILSVLELDRDQRRSLVVNATTTKTPPTAKVRPDFLSIAKSHEGFSSFFDDNQGERGSGLDSRQVRLELSGVNTDRSKVVRMWWRYLMTAIVYKIRQRRSQLREFKRQFLSFSWARLRYKRNAYINMYIRDRLRTRGSRAGRENPELLAIEDMLCVEQILLYRSIARALHVRGQANMPSSILKVRSDLGAESTLRKGSTHKSKTARLEDKASKHSSRDGMPPPRRGFSEEDMLQKVSRLCAIAERRGIAGEDDDLETFDKFVSWTSLGQARGLSLDGMSAEDTKTIRTFRTMKPRLAKGTSHSGANSISDTASVGSAMKFTFALNVQSVELMIVQEQTLFGDRSEKAESNVSSMASVAQLSDVSGLTDDQNSFGGGASVAEGDENSEPIMASEDFLLFRLPENVLLRVAMKPIEFSYMGKSGEATKIEMSVGRLEAIGNNDIQMISVGQRTEPVPIAEVDVGKRRSLRSLKRQPSSSGLQDAVSLSVAFGASGTVLQCDIPIIENIVDIETFASLFSSFSSLTSTIPENILHPSPREKVREYILRENSGARFSSLSCSIRFHGCTISVPVQRASTMSESEEEESTVDDNSSETVAPVGTMVFRCDMFEVYSGMHVDLLHNNHEAVQDDDGASYASFNMNPAMGSTRQLQMLDIAKFAKTPILSHRMVATASGLDCLVGQTGAGIFSSELSLLESPVDVETFITVNSNSVLDLNHAKREIAVEVSPVHFLLSGHRAVRIAQVLRGLQSFSFARAERERDDPDHYSPPRLDALSGYMKYLADINVGRMRLSLVVDEGVCIPRSLLTTEDEFKDILDTFVSVVTCFDLSYPNEEALSSAMQVCIDRLTGLGFNLDNAWKATNTVLLNFLQAMSIMQQADITSSASTHNAKANAVRDTAMTFAGLIMALRGRESCSGNQIVADFPNGASLSVVQLFYDRQLSFAIPTVFVTDATGIHILRVTPPESASPEDFPGENASYEDFPRDSVSGSNPTDTHEVEFGFCLRLFEKDTGHPFSAGGLPLSALGSDGKLKGEEIRRRERLVDVQLGDLDLLFSNDVLDGALDAVLSAASAILKDAPTLVSPRVRSVSGWKWSSYSLLSLTSASVLFLADDLVPFCRVTASDVVARSRYSATASEENLSRSSFLTSKSLSMSNLTPEGELFPDTMEALPALSRVPLRVSYISGDIPRLEVDVRGIQVYLLRQFVYEWLQYVKSEEYGIGRLRVKLRQASLLTLDKETASASSAELEIRVHDSSLLIPRSTTKGDLVAAEIDLVVVTLSKQARSFSIPTNSDSSLSFDLPFPQPEFLDAISSLDDSVTGHSVSRTDVRLYGLRLFVAQSSPIQARDLPAFRCFYQVDGRAGANKAVYARNEFIDSGLGDDAAAIESLCWRELTASPVGLRVLVDFTPQLRILICDPPDLDNNNIDVEVDLDEFCLLLHLWYSNMKELPVLFPYPIGYIYESARWVSYDYPTLGSKQCQNLLMNPAVMVSESAFLFRRFSLTCTDKNVDFKPNEQPSFSLSFVGAVIHVANDELGVMRVSCSSNQAEIRDSSKVFSKVLTLGGSSENPVEYAYSDPFFGLKMQQKNLGEPLPQPFQFTVYMTPKWALYNMGLQSPDMTMADFSTIFSILDFVKAFFKDEKFESPAFEAMKRAEKMRSELRPEGPTSSSLVTSSSEFRLWLTSPALNIPCDPHRKSSHALRIDGRGLWYKYAVLGDITSQECVSSDLRLDFVSKSKSHQPKSRMGPTTELVKGLSLGIRIDYNYDDEHQDVCVVIPYTDESGCGLTSSRISLEPEVLSPPTVCAPEDNPARFLGPAVGEITAVVEVLRVTWTTMVALFSGAATDANTTVVGLSDTATADSDDHVDAAATSFSFTSRICDIRLFAIDPVLGPHLPVAVVSFAGIRLTASRFTESNSSPADRSGAPLSDLQVLLDGHLWADYFKVDSRCWEPLLEAYRFRLLHEKSKLRGSGVSLRSDSDLHVNISSALLLIMDQVSETFVTTAKASLSKPVCKVDDLEESGEFDPSNQATIFRDVNAKLVHELPKYLSDDDRVAFSIRNMTGQQIRVHRKRCDCDNGGGVASIAYLDHIKAVELVFQPSMSLVSNLSVIQVAYPGFPSLPDGEDLEELSTHVVDAQIPGFEWLREIKADVFGRCFQSLVPRSPTVLSKIQQDWRLSNALKVLAEVGLDKGGRQLTLRSIVSFVNKTSHAVSICLHPDPSYVPTDVVKDGATFQEIGKEDACEVPTLLFEAALRQEGSHLGSAWFRPIEEDRGLSCIDSFLQSQGTSLSSASVGYTSRPLQLAKLVGETALMFEARHGKDVSQDEAFSNAQRSCPVLAGENRLAPFCYALEVARSPIAAASNVKQKIHGPVAYTLSIYPPIVIVNLLPERGRFELMHAVRRTVLWFSDLEPGQEVSVHTVGLDSPLLLLVNLGFCRTPVGEGALVHHGTDPPGGMRENLGGLKSIGKASKAVTKQLGKTLTALGESPDRRGLDKLQTFQLAHPVASDSKSKAENLKLNGTADLGLETGISGADGVDGKTYRVDTAQYYPSDVAIETSVVDGIGQRLELGIENVRGGGGQRRISVFCPFWIVNTTEHALRYRQDKTKVFVSGTVLSPEKDGSVPLSGGHARSKYSEAITGDAENDVRPLSTGTVYSGAPGALATSPGKSELKPEVMATLLDRNMPLNKLAEIAFMFNFHEGVLPIGHQKISVQLGDGTAEGRFASDWSRGLSLDSVGYSQIVSMHCKEGRNLELLVVVSVAPGPLSSFTKIVRFLPRYVAVNLLPHPIRLWQDSSIFRPASTESMADDACTKDRKWSFATKKESRRINQYEALWGREVLIDDKISSGTTAHRSAMYIATLSNQDIFPFSIPDTRRDRQLRIGIGGLHELTASFAADIPGEHTLRVNVATDLRLLKHVSTRASPQYQVVIPPGDSFQGELGLWFETDWGSDSSLIVKNVKRNSFAYNQTDVHVGDELLRIDDTAVPQIIFTEAMSLLRKRLNEIRKSQNSAGGLKPLGVMRRSSLMLTGGWAKQEPRPPSSDTPACDPLVLTFRTVEERLRKIRLKASRKQRRDQISSVASPSNADASHTGPSTNRFIKADLKTLHGSNFLIFRDCDNAPYAIQNRTINHTIYYRQKGCNSHQWHSLRPGQSESYTWDEPLRPRRLTVRVASESAFQFANDKLPDEVDGGGERGTSLQAYVTRQASKLKVHNDEEAVFSSSITVRLEEIGWKTFMNIKLNAAQEHIFELGVQVIASTRVLVVNDMSNEDDVQQMTRYKDELNAQGDEERLRSIELKSLRQDLMRQVELYRSGASDDGQNPLDPIIDEAKRVMDDLLRDDTLNQRHQIHIEVLEAAGLDSGNALSLTCNPYTVVYLKSENSRSLFKQRDKRRTYYVKKSLNPVWDSQSFVFDAPREAASVTRGHSLCVTVKNYRRVGLHGKLGRCYVDLHSLRDQKPLVGWFPLGGKSGSGELENQSGRGSIKLRVQWVYSIPALMDYFILLSEHRMAELQESLVGMAGQLQKKKEGDDAKRRGTEGMKTVRLNDLLRVSQHEERNRFLALARVGRSGNQESQERMHRSVSNASPKEPRPSLDSSLEDRDKKRRTLTSSRDPSRFSSYGADLIQDKRRVLEALFTERRRLGSFVASERTRSFVLESAASGHVSISAFRSWVVAQTVLNDPCLVHSLYGSELHVRLDDEKADKESGPPFTRGIHGKLRVPSSVSAPLSGEVKQYASLFCDSRDKFDTHARHGLAAVTNPGGWLTIRPLTALNLEDNYTGMYVKIRYGAESFTSSMADSRVYPTWYKLGPSGENIVSIPSDESENDLHMYVAPQKTSGSIRVSIIGESGHQKLSTKTELGMVNLPLGAVISACTHASSDNELTDSDNVPAYIRWFPLTRPKDATPIAGDCGSSLRPPETEKRSDHLFKEYFAPCIQLALVWRPSLAEDNEDEGELTVNPNNKAASNARRPERLVQMYFNADIGLVSAAVLDSQRAIELLSCSVRDIDVRYWVTKVATHMGIAVGWMQLDNQIDDAREQVILAPAPSNLSANPVLHLLAVKDNVRSRTDVLSFKFIDASVAEFDLTVEESFLIDVFEFINTILTKRQSRPRSSRSLHTTTSSVWSQCDSSEEPSLFNEIFESARDKTKAKVYIEQLFLGVVRVNMSYLKGKKQAAWDLGPRDAALLGLEGIRSLPQAALQGGDRLMQIFAFHHEKSDVFLAWSQQTSDEDRRGDESNELKGIPVLVTSLLPNVSDAPIRLQGKALNHIFESPKEVLQSIRKYYVTETLRQVYKIIGSLDFVGNPAMLVSSFFSGVRDLVVTPSTAFLKSPTDASQLGLGVAKGTISLLSHSTSGFFGFTSKVAAATGQGLAVVSLDPEYRIWHRDKIVTEVTNMNREWKRRGVQNITEMVTRPLGDVAHGVLTGIGGLVVSPVKGYRNNGQLGFLVGIGRGGIGVFIKPTVGVLDAMAHFSASVHDVAKSVNVLEKRYQPAIKYRLPYTYGPISMLTPFDTVLARASLMLQRFPMKKNKKVSVPTAETVVHMEVLPNIGSDTVAIVTCYRILLVKMGKEAGTLSSSLSWEIPLLGASLVSSRVSEHGHNGVALTVTMTKRSEDENEAGIDPSNNEDADDEDDADEEEHSLGKDDGKIQRSEEHRGYPAKSGSGSSPDYGHGTGRGQEGELLEWFTVQAEYQYRPQLAKLHNSICCVVGEFESIMRDPSLGRTGSAEGYTKFGLFHFRPIQPEISPVSSRQATELVESLDALKWIDRCVIDQIDSTTIPNNWLGKSFERAIGMYTLSPYPGDPASTSAGMQTVLEYTSTEESIDARAPHTLPQLGCQDAEDSSVAPPRDPMLGWRTPIEADGTRTFFSPLAADAPTPQLESDQLLGHQSSGTILAANNSPPADATGALRVREGSAPDSSTPRREVDRAQSSGTILAANTSPPDHDTATAFGEGQSSVPDITTPRREVDRVPSSPTSSNRIVPVPSLATGVSRTATSRDMSRIERMEALMERLLIFSAEQSLTQHSYSNNAEAHSLAATEDTEGMRREMAALRAQLEEQSRADQEAHVELEQLRQEVNILKQKSEVESSSVQEAEDEVSSLPSNDNNIVQNTAAPASSLLGDLRDDDDDDDGVEDNTTIASDEEWADAAAELSASFSTSPVG